MTRADLLSHLVSCQLAARMRSGAWLSTRQLVDALRAWLACHRAECGWLERIKIAAAPFLEAIDAPARRIGP